MSMDALSLGDAPIDPAGLHHLLACDQVGGGVVVPGTVRDHHAGRRVQHLAFEAYEAMALAQLAAIAADLVAKFAVDRVVMVHRTGRVAIGEPCVVVGVCAAHRDAAFLACREGIDRLKAEVAIWKRETFEGGEEWVTNHP